MIAPQQVAADVQLAGVRSEDVVRLSPLGHAHLNRLGRDALTSRAPAGLRPLHNPTINHDTDGGW